MRGWLKRLERDLQAPIAVRGFGSGWFAGFFGLLLAIAGLCLVASMRWPEWFATPELAAMTQWRSFRIVVHAVLLSAYAVALLRLLLRPRKVIGATALLIALGGTVVGGAGVQARETADWGVFFGID